MDAFYEEDERIVGHAADPYHRIDIRQASRNLVVRHGDRIIAETKRPLVLYERSGIAAHWKASAYQCILELAEACDVPVRWSCRAGVCHNCESGLVSGEVAYEPQPLEQPADGNVLVCCSQPIRDAVIDLRILTGIRFPTEGSSRLSLRSVRPQI